MSAMWYQLTQIIFKRSIIKSLTCENDLIIDLSIFVDFGRLASTSTVVNVFIKNKPKNLHLNFA